MGTGLTDRPLADVIADLRDCNPEADWTGVNGIMPLAAELLARQAAEIAALRSVVRASQRIHGLPTLTDADQDAVIARAMEDGNG